MILNIITPCSRPQNLHTISKSINIPTENYRWIVVFDSNKFPEKEMIPTNCETYLHKNINSRFGHSQRNFAIDLITTGHVYMNDDDTIIHPDLWDNIKHLDSDFISFKQNNSNGSLRLQGNVIRVQGIDSHNFIVSKRVIKDTRWIIDSYEADGWFANKIYTQVFKEDDSKITYIPKVLSTYNLLR
jgi:hypothetical protein